MDKTEQKTILLLEDDADLRGDLREVLETEGWRVLATDLAASALELFSKEKPDLAILDLQVPDGNGLDVCEKIRANKELSFTPVIILTASGEFETKVKGFQAGADQYLTKPVPPREVILWVQALLKRMDHTENDSLLKVGALEIDTEAHIARYEGQDIPHLTVKEFELLCFLVQNSPKVLSRKFILSRLWHTIAVDHVVNTHLANLRKKIPQAVADRIQAIPGKGYRYFD